MMAALRFWAREGLNNAGSEMDIATQDGSIAPLSADEVDELSERINCGQIRPVVVLEVNGGVIQRAIAEAPVHLVVLDEDTEGGTSENIGVINGEKVYVTEIGLGHPEPEVARELDSIVKDVNAWKDASKVDMSHPLYQALLVLGYSQLDRNHPQAYRDSQGDGYTTYQRGPVRLVVTCQTPDSQDCYLEALLVDSSCQRQGHGTRAMLDLQAIADGAELTIHVKPVAWGELTQVHLFGLFSRFGFKPQEQWRVMVRVPSRIFDGTNTIHPSR